nr:translation initiation factor IF-2-like [Setaria viridis]
MAPWLEDGRIGEVGGAWRGGAKEPASSSCAGRAELPVLELAHRRAGGCGGNHVLPASMAATAVRLRKAAAAAHPRGDAAAGPAAPARPPAIHLTGQLLPGRPPSAPARATPTDPATVPSPHHSPATMGSCAAGSVLLLHLGSRVFGSISSPATAAQRAQMGTAGATRPERTAVVAAARHRQTAALASAGKRRRWPRPGAGGRGSRAGAGRWPRCPWFIL